MLCDMKSVLLLRIIGFFDFVHRPVFYKLEKTMFWKLDLFSPQVRWGRHYSGGYLTNLTGVSSD
jgi:hypothetical protein